jgi:trigger factor
MNITKENIDDLNAVVKLSIEKQDYEATVNETLKDYRKKANVPGFRAGKVPAGMIKKMYGKAVLADEVNKVLSKELTKYIFDNNLNILGEPLPNEEKQPAIDWDKDENFEFVFDIGMSPEFEIIIDKKTKLPYYEIKVDDELIDKQIEGYTNRFGENIPAEKVGEKETTKGNFVQIDGDGNAVEAGVTAENVMVSVELIKDKAIQKSFIGSKKGDVITFNPKIAFENDSEVAHMLNIEQDKAKELDSDFTYTINEVNSFQAAEVNEELFKKVYGEETEIKTAEDFRNKISEELKENLKYSSEYRLLFDSKETLSNKVNMDLPEAFLKRWLLATNEKITAEQIETDFEHFRKDLEWSLIKSKIAKENEIKVEDDDIRESAREMATMQFRQYGMMNVPEEHLDNYAESILQNEEEKRKLAEKKMEDKVVALIKEKVSLNTKEITQEKFDKLFEK